MYGCTTCVCVHNRNDFKLIILNDTVVLVYMYYTCHTQSSSSLKVSSDIPLIFTVLLLGRPFVSLEPLPNKLSLLVVNVVAFGSECFNVVVFFSFSSISTRWIAGKRSITLLSKPAKDCLGNRVHSRLNARTTLACEDISLSSARACLPTLVAL